MNDLTPAGVTNDLLNQAIPSNAYALKVVSVHHYTERLFKFRVSRPADFRFRSGEFVMISLPGMAKPVWRAYSIASPAWDEEIEFFSIKVPNGPLTEHLQRIVPGDHVLMRKKSTGTLVLDALVPGKRLYLFSTGTGIAPFASIIRDPETYEKFETIILVHTCRQRAELKYGEELYAQMVDDPLVGEYTAGRLFHYASTTREDSPRMGRITALIRSGRVYRDLDIAPLDPANDRAMICGSMAMLKEISGMLTSFGFAEGSNARPATFVFEKAFVD